MIDCVSIQKKITTQSIKKKKGKLLSKIYINQI